MASGRWRKPGCVLAAALACGVLPAGGTDRVAQAPAAPASSARANDAGRVATPRGSGEEACRQRWRDYQRSQDCFTSYLTVSGIRPEAFQACGPELLDPSPDCGPPPPSEQ